MTSSYLVGSLAVIPQDKAESSQLEYINWTPHNNHESAARRDALILAGPSSPPSSPPHGFCWPMEEGGGEGGRFAQSGVRGMAWAEAQGDGKIEERGIMERGDRWMVMVMLYMI